MKVYDNIFATASIVPAVYTADQNGVAVDTQGYFDGMIGILAGTIDTTDTDETYNFKVQESADGSTGWTDVSGATAEITASNTGAAIRVSDLNVARERYLRVVLDVEGTTPSIACSVAVLLGEAVSAPVNS